MKEKVKKILETKNKTIPILSLPAAKLLNIDVKDLISSPEMQVKGMKYIVKRCNVGALISIMDLSVEAEAFGAKIRHSDDEIPTVEKGIIDEISQAKDISVPDVSLNRTKIYVEAVKNAKMQIHNTPVFGVIIGPYSLACRLFDVTQLMLECYDNPDDVKILIAKAADFLIQYIEAFKAVGADGVIMAEPAAGLLSPGFAKEFSTIFVEKIFNAVNSDDFVLFYHNCGDTAGEMVEDLAKTKADIFHFGNTIDLGMVLEKMPSDKVVMGNVNPILFKNGTTEQIVAETNAVYKKCGNYPNFMISTGCDIPATAEWNNIDAYFKTVDKLYV